MTGVAYAVGKYAWGQCGKCGLRVRYLELVSDGQFRHLRVCPSCYDPRHPQERLKPVSDPVALWRPTTECVWPPQPPTLSGTLDDTTGQLIWTAAVSPDSAIAGYRLYRAAPLGELTLLATLPVLRDWLGAIEEEPLSYEDTGLTVGTYQYMVEAYDMRNLSARSNTVELVLETLPDPDPDPDPDLGVFFDVVVGELHPTYPFGFEFDGFITEIPPLYGDTIPRPASVDGSILYAVWSHRGNNGFEMWWELHIPVGFTTMRVHNSTGYVDLDWLNPDDVTDQPEGQSFIYWANCQPWTEADVGETRRIEFLE